MNLNKKLGYMISSVFFFIGILWWTISELLLSSTDTLFHQIAWGIIIFSMPFGMGFAIISFFIPNENNDKTEKQEVQNNV
jgi:hypothetical protein